MAIPTTLLCSAAQLSTQGYRNALSGRKRPGPATLSRLNLALNRFRTGFAGEAGAIAPAAAFKACMVIAAFHLEADARAAIAADPARRASADPEWLAASRVRRLAYSICNQQLGFTVSDVARAAKVTKQAVSHAISELMDQRDTDPQLDRVMSAIEEVLG